MKTNTLIIPSALGKMAHNHLIINQHYNTDYTLCWMYWSGDL